MTIVAILVGIIVGAAVAGVHLWTSWRTSRHIVSAGRGLGAWLGLPLRVGLPAVALFGLARWTPAALVTALLTFALVERVALRTLMREEPR